MKSVARDPEAILRKPAKLTREEMLVMRESPSRGYEMSQCSSFAGAAEIVYAHRERFDGTGYPRGLKGEAIPLGARIVAVADALEMFISDRPHHWEQRNRDGEERNSTLVRKSF